MASSSSSAAAPTTTTTTTPPAQFRIPPNLRKTIQSIREVVGDHADEDIYEALKEANMDPNEATQQLLTQEPFHEVKRKNRRRENNVSNLKNFNGHPRPQTRPLLNGHPGPQTRPLLNDHPGPRARPLLNGHPGTRARPQFNGPPEPRVRPQFNGPHEPRGRPQFNGPHEPRARPQFNGPHEPRARPQFNGYRGSRARPQFDGPPEPVTRPQGTWERNSHRDAYSRNDNRSRPLIQGKTREFRVVKDNRVNQNETEKIKPAFQDTASNHPTLTTTTKSHILVGEKQILVEEKRAIVPRSDLRLLGQRSNTSSTTLASSNSVVGLYSKSTDPVHVPSPNSRPSGSIGAIKREVGVVGSQRNTTQTTLGNSAAQSENSASPSKGSAAPSETLGKIPGTKGANQVNEVVAPPATFVAHNKSFIGNQHNSKIAQQQSYQRSSAPNKEWKPKSTQRSNANSDDVGGKVAESIPSHDDDDSSVRKTEVADLPGKLSEVTLSNDEHVIIAQHLLVPEADMCHLTFGSFGIDVDSLNGSGHEFQAFKEGLVQKDEHLSFSNPIASAEENSGGDRVDLLNGHTRMSGSETPASIGVLEAANFADEGYSVSPQDLNGYSDIGLVQNEPQQEEDAGALSNFSEYDSQVGYSTPFFKPAMEDNLRQGLASPQEVLGSHPINGAPALTHLTQQQQQSITQMYPQVQLSHIPNFIPYRPVYPPVYVPPMAVPNFSNNPAYSLPSSGNNYVVMPGGSSHVSTGTIKYAPSLFKGAAPGGPVGYGSYTNQAGFISTPGVVGATGLDDVSRSKYKDGSIFLPNQQVDASEMWVQTPREVTGMQSGPYYGMSGQAPHAAYMHSPAGPASYNSPAPQSQHLQFPGMYHQPQPPTMANPHHMVHPQVPMGGNVPSAQVGAYQQPQLGWNTNY